MKVTLDGQNLFNEQELKIEVGSWKRDSIEKTIAGLDGVLSIDLGKRSRTIRQKGLLMAGSEARLDECITAISELMDGSSHTLATNDGREFCNVRVDSFKELERAFGGGGVCCKYEIVYTQLC